MNTNGVEMNNIKSLAAVGFAAAMLMTACSSEPDRDESGAITEEGELDAFSIKVGDCMAPEGEMDSLTTEGAEETEVESVSAVPCSEPHDSEAYHIFDMTEEDYPGTTAVTEAADVGCEAAFEAYVGVDYYDSTLGISYLYPSADTWSVGDREIVCVIFSMDSELLTGTAKGSLL